MEVSDLGRFAAQLAFDYPTENELWVGSPFEWIRTLQPRTKGAVGLRLAQTVFAEANVDSKRSGSGLLVGTDRVTVKFSMEWTAGGFKFEQFKKTSLDYIFCIGVRPQTAFAWLIPKQEVLIDGEWQEREGLTGQHGGRNASDTRWLAVNPEKPHSWMQSLGGSLPQSKSILQARFGHGA